MRKVSYLKLWIKGEEEGLSCAIKAITDFKRLRCQRTKYLETKKKNNWLLYTWDVTKPSTREICHDELRPLKAYLAITVFNDHEHWGVLALHGSVQCFNAHAMLWRTKSQRPWIPNGPWWEIPGKLCVCVCGRGGNKEQGRMEEGKRERVWNTERPQQPMLNYICGDLLTLSGV